MSNIYNTSVKVIESASKSLTDEKQIEYFKSVLESLAYAKEMAEGDNGSAEKEARLEDAAVKFANQLMFILFRQDNIDADTLAEFRTLPTPEETGAKVAEYEEAYKAKVEEINAAQKAVMDERKELDIFLAVISGMTKEQAEQKMAQYEAQLAQMNK